MKKLILIIVALLLMTSPVWAQTAEVLSTLRTQRSAKPTPMTRAQISDMLNRAVSQHPGWALLRKDGGSNCPTPYPGIGVSCDWLVHVPSSYAWDMVRDVENTAEIGIGGSGALNAGQEPVLPWPVEGQPQEPQQPQTPGGAITRVDLQQLEDNAVQRIRNVLKDNTDIINATLERMFGCKDGKSPDGSNCATAQDQADAIRGISTRLVAHDEKTNALVAFFKDGKTISAIVTLVGTIIALRETNMMK